MLHTSTCLFLQVLCSPSPQCAEGQLPELLEMLPLPRDLRHLPGPVRGKRPLACILWRVHDSASAGCRCGCVVGQECVKPLDCGEGLFCSVTDPSNTPSCQASTCAYPAQRPSNTCSRPPICAPAHPCACTHLSVCMHPPVRMHAPIGPYACTHTHPSIGLRPPFHMHAPTRTRPYACTHPYTFMRTHPPTHIHTHATTIALLADVVAACHTDGCSFKLPLIAPGFEQACLGCVNDADSITDACSASCPWGPLSSSNATLGTYRQYTFLSFFASDITSNVSKSQADYLSTQDLNVWLTSQGMPTNQVSNEYRHGCSRVVDWCGSRHRACP